MSKPQYNPNDPHVLTFTDRKFHFLHIKPEDFCIEDIAHSLSNICRYNGHCKVFYSVAEHSIKCCEKGSDWLCQMWGLLHDASEAYIGDICGPFKTRLFVDIQSTHERIDAYEELIAKAIATKFNLPWPIPKEVHTIDKELLYKEMEILWGDKPIVTMTPEYAERVFLSYFKALELKRIKKSKHEQIMQDLLEDNDRLPIEIIEACKQIVSLIPENTPNLRVAAFADCNGISLVLHFSTTKRQVTFHVDSNGQNHVTWIDENMEIGKDRFTYENKVGLQEEYIKWMMGKTQKG